MTPIFEDFPYFPVMACRGGVAWLLTRGAKGRVLYRCGEVRCMLTHDSVLQLEGPSRLAAMLFILWIRKA